MYFINIKELKKDIIEKKFNEYDRFIYLIVFILSSTIIIEFISYSPSETKPTIFDYSYSIVTIISSFLGAYFIYKANGAEKGKDFLGKYLSITWVRSIRFLLFIIPIIFGFVLLDEFLLHLSDVNSEIIYFMMNVGFLFAIYFYAYKDILEIKEQEKI